MVLGNKVMHLILSSHLCLIISNLSFEFRQFSHWITYHYELKDTLSLSIYSHLCFIISNLSFESLQFWHWITYHYDLKDALYLSIQEFTTFQQNFILFCWSLGPDHTTIIVKVKLACNKPRFVDYLGLILL